jgi:hypothetical protein
MPPDPRQGRPAIVQFGDVLREIRADLPPGLRTLAVRTSGQMPGVARAYDLGPDQGEPAPERVQVERRNEDQHMEMNGDLTDVLAALTIHQLFSEDHPVTAPFALVSTPQGSEMGAPLLRIFRKAVRIGKGYEQR